jgi:ferrous iron transport protein B
VGLFSAQENAGIMRVAMAGNPNSGKSTLFNLLTGLRQKTGNFPGVTVDLHVGTCRLTHGKKIEIIDLPGTYSLFPKSIDEQVTAAVLCNEQHEHYPQLTLVVADSTNLKRSLYLCTQLIDIGMPVILVLNMIDIALRKTIVIDESKLSQMLGVAVVSVNSKDGSGIDKLKQQIELSTQTASKPLLPMNLISKHNWEALQVVLKCKTAFDAFVQYINHNLLYKTTIDSLTQDFFANEKVNSVQLQTAESLSRFKLIGEITQAWLCYNNR